MCNSPIAGNRADPSTKGNESHRRKLEIAVLIGMSWDPHFGQPPGSGRRKPMARLVTFCNRESDSQPTNEFAPDSTAGIKSVEEPTKPTGDKAKRERDKAYPDHQPRQQEVAGNSPEKHGMIGYQVGRSGVVAASKSRLLGADRHGA
jgi:hypothetical protein